jgi:hypothetical protein
MKSSARPVWGYTQDGTYLKRNPGFLRRHTPKPNRSCEGPVLSCLHIREFSARRILKPRSAIGILIVLTDRSKNIPAQASGCLGG